MATADLEPVTVDSRRGWFAEHSSSKRPLWVLIKEDEIAGWLSFQSFYGRPAYHATAEISVYVAPTAQRRGYGRSLLTQALEQATPLGLRTLLGFIFGHNEPSLALFRSLGFATWARLPRVAEIDDGERDLLILGRRIA
jgi:L-amino acid N-acyltransferase YncA